MFIIFYINHRQNNFNMKCKLEKVEVNVEDNCTATIVTAYYKMASKHSYEEYQSWMSNMLTFTDCMVIFTQPDMVATIRRLRPSQYPTLIVPSHLNEEHTTSFVKEYFPLSIKLHQGYYSLPSSV